MTKKCICPHCGDQHDDPTPKALRVLLGRMSDPSSYRWSLLAKRNGIW